MLKIRAGCLFPVFRCQFSVFRAVCTQYKKADNTGLWVYHRNHRQTPSGGPLCVDAKVVLRRESCLVLSFPLSVFRYLLSVIFCQFLVIGFWTIIGLLVVEFEEGEDAVCGTGGEETAGVGEGVGGAVYVGVGVFAVAGVAEDFFNDFFAV